MLKRLAQIIGGFTAGMVGVIFGVGGGIILIPVLLYTGVKIKQTVGTSLAVITFIALSGTLQHLYKGSFEPNTNNLILILCGISGALIGSLLLKNVSGKLISFLIVSYFILMGAHLIVNPTFMEFSFIYQLPEQTYWLFGIIIGVISSTLGIGGGALLVPTLIYLFDVPVKQAIAIVMPFIFGLSFTATMFNLKNKFIDTKAFILLMPSALIGSFIAYTLFERVSNLHIQIGLGALLIVNGFIMLYIELSNRKS